MKRLAAIIGLLVLVLITPLVSSTPTRADTMFTVNSTVDEQDASPGDGLCASTPSGGCTLRAAIMEANALAGADTVVVPAGIYTLTIPGTDEEAAVTGDLDITSDLTLTGADANTTMINGNSLDRVMEIRGSVSVTLTDVTLVGGYWQPLLATTGGGGLNIDSGTVTLARSVVTGNTAWGCGGIANDDGVLIVSDSIISNNVSAGFGGGGLCSFQDSVTVLVATTVHSNTTSLGTNLGGGGLFNLGDMTVMSSTISSNTAAPGGGGIHNQGTLTLTASSVMSNTTPASGGGVYHQCFFCASVNFTMTNSTLSHNASGVGGGGLYVYTGTASLYNVTLVSNTANAGNGGGLAQLNGTVSFYHALIAGNADVSGEAPDASGTFISQGYNLIQSTSGYTITGITVGNLLGINPILGPLQDNSGPTLTHMLLPGSPAIDAGNPAGCTDHLGNLLTTDQRGITRPQGPACDIGAVERVPDCGTGGLPSSLPFKLYLPLILRGGSNYCP